MALVSCPECKGSVSDKAPTCPHCGFVLRPVVRPWWITLALVGGLAAVGAVLGMHNAAYAKVDELRAEQDADGTSNEHVRQRFYRLWQEHPHDAMYIYLWSRCVDDASEQLALAQQGIAADPRFAWNYNMASRALARLNRVPEAYDEALKGVALDPGNLELSRKKVALKRIIDHKLLEQPKLTVGEPASYKGLFRSPIRTPERADLDAIKVAELQRRGQFEAEVRGMVVCANPYADMCVRVYVPRDVFKPLEEHTLVSVLGEVVRTERGDELLLSNVVRVEQP